MKEKQKSLDVNGRLCPKVFSLKTRMTFQYGTGNGGEEEQDNVVET